VVERVSPDPIVRSKWGDRVWTKYLSFPLEHFSHRCKPSRKSFGSFPLKKAALHHRWRVYTYARNVLAFSLLIGVFGSSAARADIGILLSDPTGDGSSRFTEAGHASVYLSNVCPVSPIKLRLCKPGEQGSVISNYARLGEDKSYEWNVIPLSIFLYGFDDLSERPLVASLSLKRTLEEQYRRQHLKELCDGPPCSTNLDLNWRDTVATTYVRGVYLFAIHTTIEQDEHFVQYFNNRQNVNHYNGFRNNCADFARRVIAQYFPHATSADYINDFGMTSPKAIARSFTRYGERRPELGLYIIRFAQLPSDRKSTGDARDGTDAMIHQKKWIVPLLLSGQYGLPIVGVTYALTGRFNPEKEEEKLNHSASATNGAASGKTLKNGADTRQASLSSANLSPEQQWQQYRERFLEISDIAQKSGVDVTRKGISELLEEANRNGVFSTDTTGEIWLSMPYKDQVVRVGVESSNALDQQSDVQLAFALQLAKVDRFLLAKPKYRESLKEFGRDWALLEDLRTASMQANIRPRPLANEGTLAVGSGHGNVLSPSTVSLQEEF
jgi:hypothetical protein